MKEYLALIGDLRGSRDLGGGEPRERVQQQLRTVCSDLNREAEALGLLSPLTITLGDEFQALLGHAQGLWRVIFAIEAALDPVRIRFGVGVGSLDTGINPDAAIGMDGPAFHRAREALGQLKNDHGWYRILGLSSAQSLTSASLDLVSHERDKWRKNRLEIFSQLLSGVRVDAVAAAVGISGQAVYKNIHQGALQVIAAILSSTSQMIDDQLLSNS